MLKKELLELLKNAKDEDDIIETLQGIEELKKPLSLDEFKSQLEKNEVIKAYYQSTLDSGIGKGIASFKEKTLPRIIEEKLKEESNKKKSPEQIKIEELEQELAQIKKDKIKAEMSSKYAKVLNDRGMSTDLLEFVLGADDEITNKNIDTLSRIIDNGISSKVKEKITDNPPIPTNSEGGTELSGVEKLFYQNNPNLR